MRKAINTGIVTGLILTIILILGTLCRIFKPANTTLANLIFTVIFVAAITIVLWIAMDRYSRSGSPTRGSLSLVAIITTITTAVLFSGSSLVLRSTKVIPARYLSGLMPADAEPNWLDQTYSTQSIAGQSEAAWFRTPWNFAFNNLQLMLLALFVISLCIAFVYYSKNRHKSDLHENHNNHELIF